MPSVARSSQSPIRYARIDSPVGSLLVTRSDDGLRAIYFDTSRQPDIADDWRHAPDQFADVAQQLTEYFAGERTAFELPLAAVGTDFQQRVWRRLQTIPFGETMTYGGLAAELGNRNASRAVGLANGSNPISIVVPCHRVVGSNGHLTGFGGGLERKRFLLAHEGVRLAAEAQRALF